jgi:uncharacterized protein
MPTYKTPDVYVEEISTFPPSVAEVGTAIPAFIGYTQKAARLKDGDLLLKPTKIYSLKEYESLYGFPKEDDITVSVRDEGGANYKVTSVVINTLNLELEKKPAPSYLLYYAVKMYFDNGGRECYIVSVGIYSNPPAINLGDSAADPPVVGLQDGLKALELEDEPTLIVIPEAVKLAMTETGGGAYSELVTKVLAQCDKLKDRFGIFDLHDGFKPLTTNVGGDLEDNRTAFGNNFLKYGAAYYPFVKTTMNHKVTESDNASNVDVVLTVGTTTGAPVDLVKVRTGTPAAPEVPAVPPSVEDPDGTPAIPAVPEVPPNTVLYNFVKAALTDYYVIMPPSGAVAGVYAATDGSRGVWKAPANVSLAGVIEPVVKLDNLKQESLNVDPTTGKSINALRAFAGKGTLVWGARTMAGNDNEWRYISVRRFFNMAEESVKKSTYWAVFEPNEANTWVKVRGMIENYLTDKWREGALAGATPRDAFFVKCGLGSTMTPQDILEGRMNVEIGMAVVRPAEFIILKFSHKLQTS